MKNSKNAYIGQFQQIFGVEEHRLVGGRGDGMRLLQIRNGNGLEMTLSLDRCADISRLSFGGDNFGYFAPCGYVAPTYYDAKGVGFLKSFTAGFLTTCGLNNVGSPCTDEGEELPLHGTISHVAAEQVGYWIDDNSIHVKAVMRDALLFGHGLLLEREYIVPIFGNGFSLHDTVTNVGLTDEPLEMLYHCNVGYPLLDENAELLIPSTEVTPRNEHAATGIADWAKIEQPQSGYEEMCYFHKMDGNTTVTVQNRKLGKGFSMSYDTAELPFFTEWKMMGERDYVLGVEPGNALPDGRDVMRNRGLLEFLAPGAKKEHHIQFTVFNTED